MSWSDRGNGGAAGSSAELQLDVVTLDALTTPHHARTEDQLQSISKLLPTLPLYSRLMAGALEAAARLVQLVSLPSDQHLPRLEDGQDCICTLLEGDLSLLIGSTADPDLQQLLDQLNTPESQGQQEQEQDAAGDATAGTTDAAAASDVSKKHTTAAAAAAPGPGGAGRVSVACFEISSCHWGDFLAQAEKRSASPTPVQVGSNSSNSTSSSSTVKGRTGHGRSRSASPTRPASPLQRNQGSPEPRKSALGADKPAVQKDAQPSLWCKVKMAVVAANDRVAQQQEERMAEAQAQLQLLLLTQHAAAKGGGTLHTDAVAAAAAAASSSSGATGSGHEQQQGTQQKPTWLRNISISPCAVAGSFTASTFSLQGLPEGVEGAVPTELVPTCCLAAVAEGQSSVQVLVIPRQAFMNVLCLQQDLANCRSMAQLCRMPSLRHSPLKELQKMSPHMQQITLAPGSVLLEQDRVVHYVYFLLSGQVQLQVSPSKVRSASPDMFTDTHGSTAAAAAEGGATGRVKWAATVTSSTQETLGSTIRDHTAGKVMVVGVRGPGAILGDDCVREKRMAVTVVAVTEVSAIRVLPQKFITALDPLTARLFGRLRSQQGEGQELLVKDGIAARNRCELADHFRNTVLGQVYEKSHVPVTLNRHGSSSDAHKPAWVSTCSGQVANGQLSPARGLTRSMTLHAGATSLTRCQTTLHGLDRSVTGIHGLTSSFISQGQPSNGGWGALSRVGSSVHGISRSTTMHSRLLGNTEPVPEIWATMDQIRAQSTSPDMFKTAVWRTIDPYGSTKGSGSTLQATRRRQQQGDTLPEDENWARSLPRGLTLEKCEMLGSSESVDRLVQIIAGVDEDRRSQGPMLPALRSTTPTTPTGTMARTMTQQQQSAPTTPRGTLLATSSTPASPVADAAGQTAANGKASTAVVPAQRPYVDLMECCCLAVLTTAVAPGQVSGTGCSTGMGSNAMASTLDDVAAAWSAVAHDQGMQLVRWSPWQWLVIQDLEEDAATNAPAFCSTLFKFVHRWHKVLRSERLPYLQLGIGAALGSCFMTHEGGFVTAVSGVMYEAALRLSNLAVKDARPSCCIVTDGLALLLGASHDLHFVPGGYELGGPRSIGTSDVGGQVAAARGSGGGGMAPATPHGRPGTSSGSGGSFPHQVVNPTARRSARQRRQIRRKFEALEHLLEIGEALMVPPPEEMLTQPPPVTDLEAVCSRNAPSGFGSSSRRSSMRLGRGLSILTPTEGAGGHSSDNEAPSTANLARRPSLRIQIMPSTDDAPPSPGPLTGGRVAFAPGVSGVGGALPPTTPGGKTLVQRQRDMSAAALAATPRGERGGNWGNALGATGAARVKVWQDVAAAREGTEEGPAQQKGAGSPRLAATTPGGSKRSGNILPMIDSEFSDWSSDCKTPGDRSKGGQAMRFPSKSRASVAGAPPTAAVQSVITRRGSVAGLASAAVATGGRPGRGARYSTAGAPAKHGARQSVAGFGGDVDAPWEQEEDDGASSDAEADAPSFESAAAGSRALGSATGAAWFLKKLPVTCESLNLSVLGLPQLPHELLRLDSLSTLAASHNRLTQLAVQQPRPGAPSSPGPTSPSPTKPQSRSPSPTVTAARASPAGGEGTKGTVEKPALQQPLPETLAVLGWAHNEVEELPEGFGEQLPLLEVLDLTSNRLTVIPDSIAALTSLQCLSMAHNELRQLPSSFSQLASLQELHLQHNELRYMPPGLQTLQQLQVLNLSHNGLRQLPAAVWTMKQLRVLDASHNQLRQLPSNCLDGAMALRTLKLSHNQLRDIRSACSHASCGGSVSQSSAADGSSHGADTAAAGSAEQDAVQAAAEAAAVGIRRPPLQRLQLLDVSGNLLERLPMWLPSSLTELNASGNCLSSLPPDLCSKLSKRLVVLQLADNQLPGLPLQLTCLTSLRLLTVSGNPGVDRTVGSSSSSSNNSSSRPGEGGGGSAGLASGIASEQQSLGQSTDGIPGSWPLDWITAQRTGQVWTGAV